MDTNTVRATALQDMINGFANRGSHNMARHTAISNFAAIHDQYPQYNGWTDDTELVEITETTSGKGGNSALPGDWVLAKPVEHTADWSAETRGLRVIHSVRLGWNCAIEPTAIRQEN